jgi:hypothetical protein
LYGMNKRASNTDASAWPDTRVNVVRQVREQGARMQYTYPEINECDSSPCVHGTCTDQLNGYTCSCSDGFMGPMCHRRLCGTYSAQAVCAGPCQDIYKSCMRWEHEDRCQSMRQQTKFFDINCAVTCKMCHYDNTTGEACATHTCMLVCVQCARTSRCRPCSKCSRI